MDRLKAGTYLIIEGEMPDNCRNCNASFRNKCMIRERVLDTEEQLGKTRPVCCPIKGQLLLRSDTSFIYDGEKLKSRLMEKVRNEPETSCGTLIDMVVGETNLIKEHER